MIEQWQKIDVLVNSAGIVSDGLLGAMTKEQWQNVIETNLGGTYNYCHAITQPMMMQRSGSIVNLSSTASEFASRGQVNYAASKGGIDGLTRAMAKELAAAEHPRQRRRAGNDRNRHEPGRPRRGGRSDQENHPAEAHRQGRRGRRCCRFPGQRRGLIHYRTNHSRRRGIEPGRILTQIAMHKMRTRLYITARQNINNYDTIPFNTYRQT